MHTRHRLLLAKTAALSAFSLQAFSLCSAAAKPQPNIILIVADDLGGRDIAPYNPDTFYETPNLTRFAQQAVRFTNGYSANPVCSPTRVSIQTGRYPTRTNNTYWFGPLKSGKSFEFAPPVITNHLPTDEETLAEGLKKVGYQTAFAGKWHLGEEDQFQPDHRGYETAIASRLPKPLSYFSPYHNPKLPDGPAGESLPERLATESIAMLDKMAADKTKPFFLCHCFFLVHEPLQSTAALTEKYKEKAKRLGLNPAHDFGSEEQNYPIDEPRRIRIRQSNPVYAAMVEQMDTAFGRIMAEVDRLGIADDTIIIFLGDNGGLATGGDSEKSGYGTSNLPLRGGKGWLYEGGIREPFMFRWPAAVKGGVTNDTPIMSTDILPTLFAAAAAQLPDKTIDGRNLLPLLTGANPAPVHDALFWDFPHYGTQGGFPGGAVRIGDWKLLERYTDGRVQLYNLAADLGEQHDLAATEPARVATMRARLHAWYKEVGARFLQKTKNGPTPWRPADETTATSAAPASSSTTTPATGTAPAGHTTFYPTPDNPGFFKTYVAIPGLRRPDPDIGWDD